MKPILYVTVGIPGSGKTIHYYDNMDKNITRISSDDYRIKYNVKSPWELMFKDTRDLLKQNKDVYFDATNLSQKKRKNIYQQFKKLAKVIIIEFLISISDAIRHVETRNKKETQAFVPIEAIGKLLKVYKKPKIDVDCCDIISILIYPHNAIICYPFRGNTSHDSIYHLETINEHIYMCHDLAKKMYPEWGDLRLVAKYHDIGKHYTKNKGVYYGHAQVSAYLARVAGCSELVQDSIDEHMDYSKDLLDITKAFIEIDSKCCITAPNVFEYIKPSDEFMEKYSYSKRWKKLNCSYVHVRDNIPEYQESIDSLLKDRSSVISINHHGEVTTICRGLPKFYNVGERDEKPSEYDTYKKLDGSMIQVFKYENDIHVLSRGTISINEYTEMFREVFKDEDKIEEGYTYIYELIGKRNRIVVNYKVDLDYKHICTINNDTTKISMNEELKVDNDDMTLRNIEGYILIDNNNKMFKAKTNEYSKLHKFVGIGSNKSLAECMIDDDLVDDVYPLLDEEMKLKLEFAFRRKKELDEWFKNIDLSDRKAFFNSGDDRLKYWKSLNINKLDIRFYEKILDEY